ncbi:hypothetical protein ABBQ32_003475 [Trebouxia sp. C0010 RCD-2024]
MTTRPVVLSCLGDGLGMQVAALQQQLECLQQEVVSIRTAQQQVADQLQEALNDNMPRQHDRSISE